MICEEEEWVEIPSIQKIRKDSSSEQAAVKTEKAPITEGKLGEGVTEMDEKTEVH